MEYAITVEPLHEMPTAVMRATVAHDGIGAFLGRAFGQTLAVIRGQGMEPAGPPFARYVPAGDGFDVEAGFPCPTPIAETGEGTAADDVRAGTLPAGLGATTMHVGAYEAVVSGYQAIEAWFGEHDYAPVGPPWESYLDGPEVAQPRTVITWPCQPTGT